MQTAIYKNASDETMISITITCISSVKQGPGVYAHICILCRLHTHVKHNDSLSPCQNSVLGMDYGNTRIN